MGGMPAAVYDTIQENTHPGDVMSDILATNKTVAGCVLSYADLIAWPESSFMWAIGCWWAGYCCTPHLLPPVMSNILGRNKVATGCQLAHVVYHVALFVESENNSTLWAPASVTIPSFPRQSPPTFSKSAGCRGRRAPSPPPEPLHLAAASLSSASSERMSGSMVSSGSDSVASAKGRCRRPSLRDCCRCRRLSPPSSLFAVDAPPNPPVSP